MLVIQALRRLRGLPVVVVLGIVLMGIAGTLDVVVHLTATAGHAHGGSLDQHAAHVLGIAGMTLVLAGVVTHGARRHRRPRAAHGGLDRNAPR